MRKRASFHVLLGLALVVMVGTGEILPAQTGQTCGGIGNLKCPEGQACRFPQNQCNVPDLAGTCVPLEVPCSKQGPPICGCDGETYANECELLLAGVRPLKQGACGEGEGRSNVCKSDSDCKSTEFCEFRAGTCGEKGSGRCIVKPQICPEIFQPVCGCDNRTYPNDCFRRAAGVSLRATGECPAGSKPAAR